MFNSRLLLTYWIIILPIITIFITSFLFTYKFIKYEKVKFEQENKQLEKNYTKEIKERTKKRIQRVIKIIETNIEITRNEEKENLKNIVNIAHETIIKTFERYKNSLSKEQILNEIKKQLEHHRFYNNQSGYFFIIDLNNTVIMQPQVKEHEELKLDDIQDIKGKFFIKELTNIAKSKKEGFSTWYWTKPKENKHKKKIGFIKVFEPLNIYIGTARYEEDINNKIEKDALKIINSIRYGKDEYLFALKQNGVTISHINKDFINIPFSNLSKIEQKIIKNIILEAKKNNSGFIYYTPTSYNLKENISKKISYVSIIPSLKWIIGTGQYTTKIDKQIKQKKLLLIEKLNNTINSIILVATIITIILILIMTLIARKIQSKILEYEKELHQKNQKLKELNENLEKKVYEQTQKNLEKDQILHHQSKLASMGEMIGNIAHQWRQPLSAISTAASGIKLHDEMNILKKDIMNDSLDAIISNTKLLSNTIDDFSNFFKKDKVKIVFDINKSIDKVLKLISANLKNKNIEIINVTKQCKIYNLENELIQALLNIINNAKDALLENDNLKEKYIFISQEENNTQVIIKIKDNAGGINERIIDKIFEPYFTTKFKSQGTGIGLYMSQIIIANHMNGELNAANKIFEYKNKSYKGAEFTIILKKNS
ncbi:Cache sensor-containing signal transduction histidine kinase [Malaciobacter marinus]|uniref:histidine kinase n=2 Tax=Malaciobacter marinus TaxID=505249 RepID=A0A347TNI3_9BACT|nr:cache domain-containing protein [Malaciobacter marinus]AXX88161.1 Cache sensor-containing signal transduction histidine kinase [Malaciobacter marinus]